MYGKQQYVRVEKAFMLNTRHDQTLESRSNSVGSIQRSHMDHLGDRDGDGGGLEDGVGAGEGLGTGLEGGDDVGVGDTLAGDEVVEEALQVTVEAGDVAGGNEGEDGGVAVGAGEEAPGGTGDLGGGDLGSRAGDGAGTAVGAEPDHDLVLVVGADGGGEPQVVGDISDDVGASVAGVFRSVRRH